MVDFKNEQRLSCFCMKINLSCVAFFPHEYSPSPTCMMHGFQQIRTELHVHAKLNTTLVFLLFSIFRALRLPDIKKKKSLTSTYGLACEPSVLYLNTGTTCVV